jgi:hypothetical protein
MAQVVLGLGTSHSPILNMEPDAWIERGSHDHKHKLRDTSGALVSFDALLERAGDSFAGDLGIERIRARHAANQQAVAATEAALYAARPDVVVMFGDDHQEVFHDDHMPSLGIYLGDTILRALGDHEGAVRLEARHAAVVPAGAARVSGRGGSCHALRRVTQ